MMVASHGKKVGVSIGNIKLTKKQPSQHPTAVPTQYNEFTIANSAAHLATDGSKLDNGADDDSTGSSSGPPADDDGAGATSATSSSGSLMVEESCIFKLNHNKEKNWVDVFVTNFHAVNQIKFDLVTSPVLHKVRVDKLDSDMDLAGVLGCKSSAAPNGKVQVLCPFVLPVAKFIAAGYHRRLMRIHLDPTDEYKKIYTDSTLCLTNVKVHTLVPVILQKETSATCVSYKDVYPKTNALDYTKISQTQGCYQAIAGGDSCSNEFDKYGGPKGHITGLGGCETKCCASLMDINTFPSIPVRSVEDPAVHCVDALQSMGMKLDPCHNHGAQYEKEANILCKCWKGCFTYTPTSTPTYSPTPSPTGTPTAVPSFTPSPAPTDVPTTVPSSLPTYSPTDIPTSLPTEGWVDARVSHDCLTHLDDTCHADQYAFGQSKIYHRCVLCTAKAANVIITPDGESVVDHMHTPKVDPCKDDVTRHLPMIVFKYCSLKADPNAPPSRSPTIVPTPAAYRPRHYSACDGASAMLVEVECAAWIKYLHDLSASSTLKLVATCVSPVTARTDPCSCTCVECDPVSRSIKNIKIPESGAA
jgi:hypothetical protein